MHIDMNLLTALDALLEEGSVSRAAARLHLTQPAMSRTLARIREATGDPILLRAGRAMVPSPRALAIRSEVRDLVRQARAVLSPERELDLAELERTFTIRCHDALLAVLGAELLSRARRQAPSVTLRLLAESAGDDDLRPGRVDLDIGSTRPSSPAARSEEIGQDCLVVALRGDHPCARKKLTAKRYAEALHVVVSRRGRLRDPLDDALEAVGLRRRVVASAPTSVAALHLAKACNLVVAVAARACGPMAHEMGIQTRPLPLDVPAVPIVQSWHQHLDGDKAHGWLRGLTRNIIEDAMRT